MRGYGLVLREKQFCDGLTANEIWELLDNVDGNEVFPIELEARYHESSAMGFITVDAAEAMDYDYESSGLHDFIAVILDDMENENADHEYEFRGVKIYMDR